ncbi:MAG: ankyrin repeat domain-containing protein, partial [Pseudomonadota bacterium]|nr:ankyrin repeat domain-containing protein [Pseudomonadota bacterium]
DVNAKGRRGYTPLHAAMRAGNLRVAKLLLEKGADVKAQGRKGRTPLHTAVRAGFINGVKLLVEKGADANAANEYGKTPLHYAVRYGRKKAAHFLLEHGAVAVIGDNMGQTPLDYALRKEGTDVALICKMLLPSGALVHLAKSVVEAHEKRQKRQKRLKIGLEGAVRRRSSALEDLADTLAGIDATGCVRGTRARLAALLRRLAYPRARMRGAGAREASRASKRLRDAYEERRRRHRLAVVRALQIPEFLSELADGLAGFNLCDPTLVAAAARLDALSEEGAQEPGAAPKRARRGRA